MDTQEQKSTTKPVVNPTLLGEMLVELKYATPEQIKRALDAQNAEKAAEKESGKKPRQIGEILQEQTKDKKGENGEWPVTKKQVDATFTIQGEVRKELKDLNIDAGKLDEKQLELVKSLIHKKAKEHGFTEGQEKKPAGEKAEGEQLELKTGDLYKRLTFEEVAAAMQKTMPREAPEAERLLQESAAQQEKPKETETVEPKSGR